MTGDSQSVTRRRVLAGLGGIGGLGFTSKTGTLGSFTDNNMVSGQLQAGQIDIQVDCDRCALGEDNVQILFESLEPGDTGTRRIQLSISDESNPVQLWLRTACPPRIDPLGEALKTRLSLDRGCQDDGNRIDLVGEGWVSFTQLRQALHDGVRLDESCTTAGEGLCLVFEYQLPESAVWAVGTEAELGLELFGQQCRHVSEEHVGNNPFSNNPCPSVECRSCVELGKIDINTNRLLPNKTYQFEELQSPFDTDDHKYSIEILTVTDKVDDDHRETVCASFRLLQDNEENDAPPICAVAVGGGRPSSTSQNDDSLRGGGTGESSLTDPDTRAIRYNIDPQLTRTPGELCAVHNKEHSEDEADNQRPAISNITVFVCSENQQEVPDDE